MLNTTNLKAIESKLSSISNTNISIETISDKSFLIFLEDATKQNMDKIINFFDGYNVEQQNDEGINFLEIKL